MSLPPLNPSRTASGIALDPRTLERVVPATKRADGTVRKELKIRPGFTPQEDVSRFRGSRQQEADKRALPKGQIIGWAPPPTSENNAKAGVALSKSAKKNEKRKEKRKEKAADEKVKDNWEDDDADEGAGASQSPTSNPKTEESNTSNAVADLADSLDKKLDLGKQ